MLIWGLGAGVFARLMAEAGVAVTVIEIDPASERLARDYFGLPAAVRVIIGDARTETRRLHERFDVIVLDVFAGDAPPWHLLTREALAEAAARRTPDGVLIVNFIGATAGAAARATAAIASTLAGVAAPVTLFAPNRALLERGPDFVSTMLAVAGPSPDAVAPFPLEAPVSLRAYVQLVPRSRVDVPSGGTLLTDAASPLDAWTDAAVTAMRY